jgi:hypothetical protein
MFKARIFVRKLYGLVNATGIAALCGVCIAIENYCFLNLHFLCVIKIRFGVHLIFPAYGINAGIAKNSQKWC